MHVQSVETSALAASLPGRLKRGGQPDARRALYCIFTATAAATQQTRPITAPTMIGCHSKRIQMKPRVSKINPRLETRRGAVNNLFSERGSSRCRSNRAQIVRAGLAAPWIGDKIEKDLFSLIEPLHPRAFERADMHEDILATAIGSYESVTLLAIEPLHGSLRH
jgi:hypothetical protein